ncbi:MAG: WD40 repeat domain-containing protein [Promethearchaeota archaeon]
MYEKRAPFRLNTSSENLCWCYTTNEKVRSVAISDDGEYIVASTYSPDSSAYLFDNKPSISKIPLWAFSNRNNSGSVTYRSTETLYFNEYWYEYEHIRAGNQINFSVQSTPSVISFAIWDQPFENLPVTTKIGTGADIFQLTSDSYNYYSIFLRSGSTISYNFNTTGLVDFFIADANAFYLWTQGGSPSFYVDLQNTTSEKNSFIVPTTQDYFVVWYNEGMSSVSVDYIINYTALNVPNLSVADFYVEAIDFIPEQTFIVPNEGKWYFFIYFEPMNSPEESTSITFDVTYDIGNSMYTVDISANGDYIAAANDNNYIYLLNRSITDPKAPIWDYLGDNYFNDVAISSDGNYIVAVTGTGTIYVLNNSVSDPKLELWNHATEAIIHSVAISANGDYIAVAGWDGKLNLFSKNSSTPLWTYLAGTKIYSVSISLDGNYIVAGTYDARVLLFNKGSPSPLWNYSTTGEVYNVAINTDGAYIIAGGSEGIIYLFERSNANPLWSYNVGASLGGSDFDHCIAISQDGKYIAAGTQDSMFYYFERSSSIPLWYDTLGEEVNSIAMSANGSYIALGSKDHCIYLFSHSIDTNPPSEPLAIPGYGIFIIIGFIFVVSVILIKRRTPTVN